MLDSFKKAKQTISPGGYLPSFWSATLTVVSALFLTCSFPDFNLAPLAWFAAVPFFIALWQERSAIGKGFVLGWLFGTFFFFGTCWWLTFAPITYAGVSWAVSYFFLFVVTLAAGFFFGIFGAVLAAALDRFGAAAVFAAVFVWPATEFLRYWVTGNNWNAIGYSQSFAPGIVRLASFGGVYLISAVIVLWNTLIAFGVMLVLGRGKSAIKHASLAGLGLALLAGGLFAFSKMSLPAKQSGLAARIVVVQPDVPMSGMTSERYKILLARHFQLAETALGESASKTPAGTPTLIVFPESPMLFQYGGDEELRRTFSSFTSRNRTSLLFNSAEEDPSGIFLNSAVMIDQAGEKQAQYDKIYLLPFGEFMPLPDSLARLLPAFVGSFKHGTKYEMLNIGDAKAGVMICFESHFGAHTAEYVRRGADFIVEMTNDGYLGRTPVLRQHLANSIMRAAETHRPVIRATNVGVTAYITEDGEVRDESEVYTHNSRAWTIGRSDGQLTFYVRYGDWLAWLCSVFTLAVIFVSLRRGREARA